ncbi:conjugative transposon protein TraJ [Paraflavitalea sp. CAU 1676]|uniref:conjugative transposon protein TraJ n=1 Tax=Paraflavitalea sp. CAU 1676 TaxID=3032598 RepID=UPI0023D9D5C0|nr:conjugative transposon protein TraJ [Paraflavitalea sp. CAU 1676]MDF2188718.1 conjugative transposon protein TraJ [Paraflavitalea sp. CAU 1676]
MKKGITLLVILGFVAPVSVWAQNDGSLSGKLNSLHSVLEQLYDELMPLCSQLTNISVGIAGFATLFYIAYRVWGHLARTEPIDFYPLMKPFVLGFCIMNFSTVVLPVINGVMKPTVTGTKKLVDNSNVTIETLLRQKDSAVRTTDIYQMYVGPTGEGDRSKWYKYTYDEEVPASEGWLASIRTDLKFAFAKAGYAFRNAIKEVIAEILQLLFAAVSLCINTLRTFNLVILSILGPLVFALGTFDGFGFTIKQWLARYINVFMWLPVAHIFGMVIGRIQINMLKLDLSQIAQQGDTYFSRTDMGYLVFLIIGIYGYTTVPAIANQIMMVSGADALTSKFAHDAKSAASTAVTGPTGYMVQKLSGQ